MNNDLPKYKPMDIEALKESSKKISKLWKNTCVQCNEPTIAHYHFGFYCTKPECPNFNLLQASNG